MLAKNLTEALTFDDVLLVPAFSDVVPAQVSTQTQLLIVMFLPGINGGIRMTEAYELPQSGVTVERPPGIHYPDVSGMRGILRLV